MRRGLRGVWIAGVLAAAAIAFFSLRDEARTRGQRPAALDGLKSSVEAIANKLQGMTGVAVEDLKSGEKFSIQGGTTFVQASSIKIAILISVLKGEQEGKLHLSDMMQIRKADFVGGSGVLQNFSGSGETLTLRDLAVLMIMLSDNSATNYVIDRETIGNVNETMSRFGFNATRLNRRMMDAAAQRAGRENFSTPDEMCRLLEQLYSGKLLDDEHTRTAMEILSLPKDTPLGRGLPAPQAHADKPGVLPGVRTDSGIVPLAGRPYVLSVMINKAADEAAGEKTIEEISRTTYEYFKSLAKN